MTVDNQLRTYPFEEFRGDLPEELLRMVDTDPVTRVALPDGLPPWLVLGYPEVCVVLFDPRFVRYIESPPATDPESDAESLCPARDLAMNGPSHTSLRRLAARAFTPRRVGVPGSSNSPSSYWTRWRPPGRRPI
ncbi:MAG: hypothetical protein QOE61_130 [Micromonosporaceae bacterium]|jgi:cytochrome P450|nr:hypothetical protein [Micromonosporaceae bacterium]